MSTTVAQIRPQVGLMLSIGLPPKSEGNPGNYPKKLDHFRPKPGALNQYLPALYAFDEAYPDEPKEIDIILVSDDIDLVFDVRPKAWGQSSLKALGTRNLAGLPADEFLHALYAYEETLDVYPDDDGEIVQYKLTGPDDPRVRDKACKMYGVLRFSIPEVTGLMTLAEISTTSRKSMKNLYAGLQLARAITGGHMIGLPLRLSVRPTKGRYLDTSVNPPKKKSTTYYELVIDSRESLQSLYETVLARRSMIGAQDLPALPPAPIDHANLDRDAELIPESRAIEAATTVPSVDIETFTEDEPEVTVEPDEDGQGRMPWHDYDPTARGSE